MRPWPHPDNCACALCFSENTGAWLQVMEGETLIEHADRTNPDEMAAARAELRDKGSAAIAALALFVAAMIVVIIITAFLKFVAYVDDQERECIQRNGENYCKTVAP